LGEDLKNIKGLGEDLKKYKRIGGRSEKI